MTTYSAISGPYLGHDDLIPQWGAILHIDDRIFLATKALEVEYSAWGGMEITAEPPTLREENKCPHCGRADYVRARAFSIDDAVDLGWLVPVREVS